LTESKSISRDILMRSFDHLARIVSVHA
jgi:hypothetical protein